MAFETGIADNERDLLARLNTFLTTNPSLVASGQNWRQIHSATVAGSATTVEQNFICWTAPGAGGADEIYVAALTANSITSDIYNITFAGGTYYEAGAASGDDWLAGLRNKSPTVTLFADNRQIKYWLIADGRRFILTVAIGNIYSTAYAGFVLPAVPPDEYPYPLAIGGSADGTLRRYSTTTDQHSSIVDPRAMNLWLMYPSQSWQDFYGYAADKGATAGASGRYVTPCGNNRFNSYTWPMLSGMNASPGGAYPLYPTELRAVESTAANLWGVLDGVWWLPGMARAAEDTVTIEDRHFIIFPGGHRTGPTDYFAVELR